MGRFSVLVCIAFVLSAFSLLEGQTIPREPVITIPQGGSPAPTPTPLPNPSGNYSGNVTITAETGTYPQQWTVVIKARSCRDCAPGQYWLHTSNFDGVRYVSGNVERGGVSGIVNQDGTAIDLRLQATNCLFINESTEAPRTTEIHGGSFGRAAGPKLQIRDGRITGSLSGWNCFGTPYSVSVDLRRTTTTTPADCSFQGGWYYGTFANSRGQSGAGWIYVYQSNCYFSARAEDFGVNVEGLFSSPTSGQFNLSGIGSCDATGSGSGTRQSNGTVVGSYTGTIGNGCGSLAPGSISGSFTLAPY
jgi:hypothetical protein